MPSEVNQAVPACADTRPPRPVVASEASLQGVPTLELVQALDELLGSAQIHDYCPNGLQVQGRPRVRRVLLAVTASLAAIREAARQGADALLVHHGWFWKGEPPVVTGMKQRRMQELLRHDINLIAYHLPLDLHPELGNNAMFARRMGWSITATGGERGLLAWTDVEPALDATALQHLLEKQLARRPLLLGDTSRPLHRIAWCTGAAQDFLESAVALGADAYISGEVSERTTHTARELGVVYAAAGHHATERDGVQAVGQWVRNTFNIPVDYFEDANPV